MYKVFSIFCAIIIFGCSKKNNESYFVGQITYQYSYSSNILNLDSLTKTKPKLAIFQYDLKNYQSQFIGKDTSTYYYLSDINKDIWWNKEKNSFECEDYGVKTDSIISFKVYDSNEKFLGHNIRILEYQSKYFCTKYYVSKDVKISPSTYKKHLAYNWSFYGNKTKGGLILKLEHKFKNYIMFGKVSKLKSFNNDFKAVEVNMSEISNTCINY